MIRENISQLDLAMITNSLLSDVKVIGEGCYVKENGDFKYIGTGYTEYGMNKDGRYVRNIFLKPITPVQFIEVTVTLIKPDNENN
jgi:hypothetical protein